jgi:hypothetical protein
MKMYHAVQKLLVGDRQRETGDLISLLSFLENRLKKAYYSSSYTYLLELVYHQPVPPQCVSHKLFTAPHD